MASVERSIEVEVPVERVYDQWTQFDQFPMFMEGLRDVRRLDARQVLWRAEVMGRVRQWRAEITEQVPEQRIAWRSRSGAPGAGLVTFHRLTPDRTRVVLRMDHEPADPPETVAARIEGDLRRFKALIEARGEPTGWPDRVPRRPAFPARDAPRGPVAPPRIGGSETSVPGLRRAPGTGRLSSWSPSLVAVSSASGSSRSWPRLRG